MTDQRDELERLERRVAQLETLVRQLLADRGRPTGAPLPPTKARAQPPPARPAAPRTDWEQWLGQRGLLIVGVLALLATGGFFLNYAFDRGWIPLWLRATGAATGGITLAFWGDRLVSRGLRRYGAALIGGGGGLAYLGVWAAAGPYQLVSHEPGVVILALLAAGVAFGAVRHTVEGLAVWALVGAYLAPAFLPTADAPVARLLAYLAVVGISSAALARRFAWRVTLDLALGGLLLLPLVFAPKGVESPVGVAYFGLGGVAGLVATVGSGWSEARVGALGLSWVVILFITITGVPGEAVRWTALGAGAALAAVAWWQARKSTPRDAAEITVYLGGPLGLVYLAAHARPDALAAWGGVVGAALAVLYLADGWPRGAAHLVGMGVALAALAVSAQWDGTTVAVGWTALAVAAVVADRAADQAAARNVAAGVLLAAFLQLFSVALADRPAAEPAFTGPWAAAWYAALAGGVAAAWWWRSRPGGGGWEEGRSVLWLATAAAVLLGGTLELQRLLRHEVRGADEQALAMRIVTCVFWLVYAAAVVRFASRWKVVAVRTVMLATALGLAASSFVLLFAVAAGTRPATDTAFRGAWSLGWYAQSALPMVAARWWMGLPKVPDALRAGHAALWAIGGAAVLLGGSIELHRFFAVRLAGDLAISTFWLVYAGAAVRLGFWLERRPVRVAGLGVAGLAALKIALYDLSELEALYRVGSFFGLAIIALTVAYAYNRKASNKGV